MNTNETRCQYFSWWRHYSAVLYPANGRRMCLFKYPLQNVFVIASRLFWAKIKCSICSSQCNSRDSSLVELLSITLIFRQRVSYRIYLVTPTGYLGIAVPPSLAHFSHDFRVILIPHLLVIISKSLYLNLAPTTLLSNFSLVLGTLR